jgi:putative phosphoesterase
VPGIPLAWQLIMRILLLSDIHANWPAVQAVQEPHDLCLCLGDLVGYGLEPRPVVDWVRQHVQHAVRGDHDHWLAQDVHVTGSDGLRSLGELTRRLSRDLLSPDAVRFLARLPLARHVTLDGTRYLLVHATPRDPLNELAPADSAFWADRLQNIDAEVICVGHSHQPFVLTVADKLIINPGSVGMPLDGDPRASYAVIEDRRVEIKRVAYPIENTVRTIQKSQLPEDAKTLLIKILQTGGKIDDGSRDGQGKIEMSEKLFLESG